MTLPARFIGLPIRDLTEVERALLSHLARWGSTGLPISKLGKRWFWQFRSLQAPVLYRTKREAVAAFERYHSYLVELLAYDSWRRATGAASE